MAAPAALVCGAASGDPSPPPATPYTPLPTAHSLLPRPLLLRPVEEVFDVPVGEQPVERQVAAVVVVGVPHDRDLGDVLVPPPEERLGDRDLAQLVVVEVARPLGREDGLVGRAAEHP